MDNENNIDLKKVFEAISSYRKKILIFFSFFIFIAIIFFIFSKQILEFVCSPLIIDKTGAVLNNIDSKIKYLIYTSPLETFWVKTKISAILSLAVLFPIVIIYILKKINKIKKKFHLYIVSIFIIVLFYGGIIFSFYVLLPVMISFFLNFQTQYLLAFWTLRNYTDLVVSTSFLMGVVFEFPILISLLVWFGIITYEKIIASRKYIIVLIFVLSALATPPDVFSQLMIAIPLLVIFEINLFILKLIINNKNNQAKNLKNENIKNK